MSTSEESKSSSLGRKRLVAWGYWGLAALFLALFGIEGGTSSALSDLLFGIMCIVGGLLLFAGWNKPVFGKVLLLITVGLGVIGACLAISEGKMPLALLIPLHLAVAFHTRRLDYL